jgi:hypothetical protein
MDALHALGVLGRQRRDGCHGITAMGGNGLDVRLDAGTTGGIGAGNGKHVPRPRCAGREVFFGQDCGGAVHRDIPSPVLAGQVQRVFSQPALMAWHPVSIPTLAAVPSLKENCVSESALRQPKQVDASAF